MNMNSKVRRGVALKIAAAVLMTAEQNRLREIAEELRRGTLGPEIGELLQSIISASEEPERPRPYEKEPQTRRATGGGIDLRELALHTINRRGLPRRMVARLMANSSPEFERSFSEKASMKELLRRYFSKATDREARSFVSALLGETTDDYLKGIAERGRA